MLNNTTSSPLVYNNCRIKKPSLVLRYGDEFKDSYICAQKAKAMLLRNGMIASTNPLNKCGFIPYNEAEVKINSDNLFFDNVCYCHSSWRCPFCAFVKILLRNIEILRIINRWKKLSNSNEVSFLTLTTSHTKSGLLEAHFRAAESSLSLFCKALRDDAKFHISHRIKVTDITWSMLNGWHLHWHFFLLHNKELPPISLESLRHYWKLALRQNALHCSSEHGVSIQSASNYFDYILKGFKKESVVNGNYTMPLLAKHACNGNLSAQAAYQEYLLATRYRHRVQFGRGLVEKVDLNLDCLADRKKSSRYVFHLASRGFMHLNIDQRAELHYLNFIMDYNAIEDRLTLWGTQFKYSVISSK